MTFGSSEKADDMRGGAKGMSLCTKCRSLCYQTIFFYINKLERVALSNTYCCDPGGGGGGYSLEFFGGDV